MFKFRRKKSKLDFFPSNHLDCQRLKCETNMITFQNAMLSQQTYNFRKE